MIVLRSEKLSACGIVIVTVMAQKLNLLPLDYVDQILRSSSCEPFCVDEGWKLLRSGVHSPRLRKQMAFRRYDYKYVFVASLVV